MRIVRGPSAIVKLALTGAGTTLTDGALISSSVTTGASGNLGCGILSPAAATSLVGCLVAQFLTANDSTPATGVTWNYGEVELALPGSQIAGDYSQAAADLITVTSFSTATITLTSLQVNLESCWAYVVSGTGAGLLGYIITSNSGSCVIKSTPTIALDSTSKIILVMGFGKKLMVTDSTGVKFSTTAAVGTAKFWCLESQIKYQGSRGWETLDPTKHDNLTGLNNKNVQFRSIVIPYGTLAVA